MRVTAPDGTRWKVGRQWWPDRLRLTDDGYFDPPGGGDWLPDFGDADDFLAVLALAALAIVVIVFVITAVIPLLAFTVELVVAIVVFFAGLAGRLLFRRPWTVRARASGEATHRWRVVGFGASGRMRDEVAEALRGGRRLPSDAYH